MNLVFIGMIFEMIITLIGAIISWLILRKYFIKRHQLTLYLFIIFINLVMAVIFAWISKIIVLTTEIDYVYNQPNVKFPNTPLNWLLFRIVDFRISILFVAISVLYSYLLKVGIFEKGYSKIQRYLVFGFGGYVIFFTVFIYERGNTILDAINFLNILIFMAVIYISFVIRLMEAYKTVDDLTFKRAFYRFYPRGFLWRLDWIGGPAAIQHIYGRFFSWTRRGQFYVYCCAGWLFGSHGICQN